MDETTKAMIKDMLNRGMDNDAIMGVTGATKEQIDQVANEGKQSSLLDRLGIITNLQAAEMQPIEDLRTMPLGTQETFGEKLKPTIPTGGSIFTDRFKNFNQRVGETGIQQVVSPYEYTFNEDVLKEEEDAQYNLPEKSSIFSNILDSGLDYAKDIGGRYIASKALGGAGQILFGIPGAIAGTIGGLMGGGDLFDTNTRSQQAYDILNPSGQLYADSLYGPGGILQGYNKISKYGRGTMGTLINNLARFPNMSQARKDQHIAAINTLASNQDSGINAVTRPGTHAYDFAPNYMQPSGNGDSGSSWSGGTGGFGGGFSTSSSGTEETF